MSEHLPNHNVADSLEVLESRFYPAAQSYHQLHLLANQEAVTQQGFRKDYYSLKLAAVAHVDEILDDYLELKAFTEGATLLDTPS